MKPIRSKLFRKDAELIRRTVKLVTNRLGMPGLDCHISVVRMFDAPTAFAYASKMQICLNKNFWRSLNKETKRRVIAHEVCHLAQRLSIPSNRYEHDRLFFKYLKKSGFLKQEREEYLRAGNPGWYIALHRRYK